ncbi:hypothetical protein O1611_g7086 [Lasiodiplodia mahajangana]|uniref:Uncharacterized protein n=1 Tax=Lasiodiplodia mahajangana TaxID=1108764 RepID=A0ACC2JGW4_9PEZI|nr:hypothetical protein O1611_g7086 [Lasiodiplodia mahajangana]
MDITGHQKTVKIKTIDGIMLEAWLWGTEERAAAVVMTTGFNCIKEMGLSETAESFYSAGFNVLLYDSRSVGGSEGLPRNQIDPAKMVEDISDVVSFATTLPSVDPCRVVLWGMSFGAALSGVAAAIDRRVAAVIMVCPLFSYISAKSRATLFAQLMRDRKSQIRGNEPFTLRPFDSDGGNPAGFAGAGGPGGKEAYNTMKMAMDHGHPNFRDRITLQTYYKLVLFRPKELLKDLLEGTPTMMVVSQLDDISPPAEQKAVFESIKTPKRLHYVCNEGHMSILDGNESVAVRAAMADFLMSGRQPNLRVTRKSGDGTITICKIAAPKYLPITQSEEGVSFPTPPFWPPVTIHPLASVPGPRLAAMTYWYETYYDMILGGQYFKRIKDMHDEYGPIVRIRPDEVHFNDPEFINDVYPTSLMRKTNKPLWVGWRSGKKLLSQAPQSMVATVKHETHRLRRSSIKAFFSTASIGKVEPIFKDKLDRILRRWKMLGGSEGHVVNMLAVFQAFASDNITTYAFGDCFNFIDDEDWGEEYFASQEKYFKLTHVFGSFPIVMRLVNNMPTWLLGMMMSNLSAMTEKQEWRVNRVREIRRSPDPNAIRSTIFEGILSSSLPEDEKTDTRMAQDAQLIVLGGESTTGYTLQAILFELLSHPDDYDKAKSEVVSALSNDDIEVLRLHPGVVSRMTRISPDKDIVYEDKRRGRTYVLPAGTPSSMTTLTTHMNPETFEHPDEFIPQRWIDNPKLSRALIAFSRGSRNCVGQEFARREMSMIIATILKHYDVYQGQSGPTLELYETTRERDIVANSEMIIPMPAKGSRGLRHDNGSNAYWMTTCEGNEGATAKIDPRSLQIGSRSVKSG